MWQRWNGTSKIFEKSDNNGSTWLPLGLDATILTQGLLWLVSNGTHVLGNAGADCRLTVRSNTVWAFRAENSSGLAVHYGVGAGSPESMTISNNSGATMMTLSAAGLLYVVGAGTHRFGVQTGIVEISIEGGASAGQGGLAKFIRGGSVTVGWVGAESALTGGLTDALTLYSPNPHGVSIRAAHGTGELRFFSGGVQRGVFVASGQFVLGTPGAMGSPATEGFGVHCNHAASNINVVLRNGVDLAGGLFIGFYNSFGSLQGYISSPTTSSVSYNTSSDQRLKRDLGVVTITDVLSQIIVHDFEWIMDKTRARGIFAQEAVLACPQAITEGDDELSANGLPSKPWAVDYSKFVPDLIVGWQNHEARIAALEASLGK